MRLPYWQGWLRSEERGGRDGGRSGRARQAGRRASRRPSAVSRHSRLRLLERLEARCVLTATLTGQLFHDLDGDQTWEPLGPSFEPALGCWSVYLDENRNGALDDGEPRQLTSVDGAYTFTGLDSGEHVVNVVPDPAFDRTRPIRFGLTTRLETGSTVDHVFDPVRNILYSAQTDRILRTKTDQSQELLTSLGVGEDISALDVTPDGQFLVVGEAATANGAGRVYKIALETGDITTIPFPLDVGEGGVVDVVVLNEHRALVTTHSTTGNLVALRQVDLDTNTVAPRGDDFGHGAGLIQSDSRFQRDAARTTVVLAEAHDSTGPLHRFNIATLAFVGSIAANQDLENAHLAVDRTGELIAVESADLGLKVFHTSGQVAQVLPHFRGGIAFDSLRDILYAGDTTLDELVAIDTTSWNELYRVAAGEDLPDSGVYYEMQISRDAKFLSVTTPSGTRWVALDRPVPYVVTLADGQTVNHLDFGFRWNGGNRRPVAVANAYQAVEDGNLIESAPGVLGNDVDLDGDSLLAMLVAGPNHGSLSLNADGSFAYQPAADFSGSDSFTYRAFDGQVQSCSPATVNLHVMAVNDPPTDIVVANTTVVENQVGAQVGQVVVIDVDPNEQFTFQVSDARFEIVNSYLRLRQLISLDHEAAATIELSITAADSGTPARTITETVAIQVADVNEYDPTISTTEIDVVEGSTTVGTVQVNDQDSTQTIDIAITGGNDGGIFSMDARTGQISVNSGHALDHEGTSVFVLTVTATDSVQPYRTTTSDITITVTDGNENSPVVQDADWTIPENTPIGAVVGTVVATDADPGQTLTYSILSGNEAGAFTINPQTGEITVAAEAPLDREQTEAFLLTVRAADNGVPARTGSAEVVIRLGNVNEFAPTAANQSTSLAENAAVATIVATIVGHDADAVSHLTYSLASNPGGAFQIDPQTGVLSIASSTGLDAEAVTQVEVEITITDTESPTRTGVAKVTVLLTDVNEFDPITGDRTLQIPSTATVGHEVGDLSATDLDVTKLFQFSITAGNDAGLFAIEPSTGIITVAANSLPGDMGDVVLTISVSDGGNPSRTDEAAVTIQVTPGNLHAPVAADATWNLDENSAAGTVVGTVTATDADPGTVLTYWLSDDAGAFHIDSASGEISVANGSSLNYENATEIHLTVSVTDNGVPLRSDQAQITIRLRDVNESAPSISPVAFSLAENAPNGTRVGSVFAWDADVQQAVTYSISGSVFSIDASTGEIKVANSGQLNYESSPSHSVTVTATDNGSPAKSSSAEVTINLLDLNESVPVVPNRTFNVAENAPIGTVLGTLAATDADAGQTLSFHLFGGNSGGTFEINSVTGELKVGSLMFLDAETLPQYILLVLVSDNGQPPHSGLGTVTVNVQGVNEAPLTLVLDNTSVVEDLAGATIGLVSVVDPDAGDTHTFSVDDTRFEIDANRILKLKDGVSLAAEDGSQIPVKITATDSGGLSAAVTFVLNVMAINIPWQNPDDPLDVNGDGIITPSDVLQVINEINSPDISDGRGKLPGVRPDDPNTPFYDVNGDGVISPIDVLIIINELNRRSTEIQSEGEGGGNLGFAPQPTNAHVGPSVASPRLDPATVFAWTHDDADDELETVLDELASDLSSVWAS